MSCLGFDFGLKRIGVAVGEALIGSARALKTLPARDGQPDWRELDELIEHWQPSALVVGLPLNETGEDQPISRRARAFARKLDQRFPAITVHLADERYSTISAQHEQRERRAAGVARRTRSGDLDKLAAAIILESWFREPTAAIGDNDAPDQPPEPPAS